MEKEILRLFKGFIGEESSEINKEALKYGVVISSKANEDIVKEAIKQYGKDSFLVNQTFHKSWSKVKNASFEQLLFEQILHYFTTYGFEALGFYNEGSVYIPAEKLEVPELDIDKIELVVIRAYKKEEVTEKLMKLLMSGIALSKQTVEDIKNLFDFIDKKMIDEIANREIRNFLYEKFNVMPQDPEVFLRYLIYRATGLTLKIQNRNTYEELAYSDKKLVYNMLVTYGDYSKLSSIFLRNKKLFLALKTKNKKTSYEKNVNTIINKLRKLADVNHKPLSKNFLDNIVNYARTSKSRVTKKAIYEALDKTTLFRAVRILNALGYELSTCDDIVYRVRNGKGFVSKKEKGIQNLKNIELAYSYVKKYIAEKIASKVKNKKVFIPSNIEYMVPSSEKQFIGNIPEGSYVVLPQEKNLIVGIYWDNLPEERVDLDLRLFNEYLNFGWNSNWRSESREYLFSGDMTDAYRGATEAFFIASSAREQNFLFTVNDFTSNYSNIPFKIIVATEEEKTIDNFGKSDMPSYSIDPNKIIASVDTEMNIVEHERMVELGILKIDKNGEKKYCFTKFSAGKQGCCSRSDKYTMGALNYCLAYNDIQLKLSDLLEQAGAHLVREKNAEEDEEKIDIDLSIEKIDKTSLIDLLNKK